MYACGEARPCCAATPNCGELPLADVHSNGLYGTVCPEDCLIVIGDVSLAEIPLSRERAAGLFREKGLDNEVVELGAEPKLEPELTPNPWYERPPSEVVKAGG